MLQTRADKIRLLQNLQNGLKSIKSINATNDEEENYLIEIQPGIWKNEATGEMVTISQLQTEIKNMRLCNEPLLGVYLDLSTNRTA